MLQIILLVAIIAIATIGLFGILDMKDSPNPNCFQSNDPNESKCPFLREQYDQGNTEGK